MGSGEIFFWPGIAADHGFRLIWLTIAAITLQYVLNTEFIRYTLATGEAAVIGFARLSPVFGWFFIAAAILPWMWPGWAMGGATSLTWIFGGNPVWIGAGSLVAIGLLLTGSRVAYKSLELAQKLLIAFVLTVALGLAVAIVRPESLAALGQGLVSSPFPLPASLSMTTLLAALAFCGAGGTINLAAANWARDKGFGMAVYAPKVVSPFSGEVQAVSEARFAFDASGENIPRWQAWWRLVRREELITFLAAGAFGLIVFMLVAHALVAGQGLGVGMGTVKAQADALGQRYGQWMHLIFALCVSAIFLTSAVGVLDHAARIAAGLVRHFLGTRAEATRWLSESGLYFIILWTLIGFGLIVLLGLDVSSPPALLTIAGALSGIVMFAYSCLALWLNLHMKAEFDRLDPDFGTLNPFRIERWRLVALILSILLFGFMSAAVILDTLSKLAG